MKLLYKRTLEDNVRTTKITAKLGSTKMTIEEEKELIADYSPVFEYKDLTFKGYFKVADNGKDIVETVNDSDGELVTLSLVNKEVKVNEGLTLELSIATKDVKSSELGTILNTKDKVAEAKILLFENVIYKAVKAIIEGLKAKDNNFETDSESDEF